MSPEFYRIAHVVGVFLLFLGLGGMLAFAGRDDKAPGLFPAMHGVGLIVMIVAGFGRIHKAELGVTFSGEWPFLHGGNWLFVKIGCWLLLALLPVLCRKGLVARPLAVLLAVALGGLAFWLAVQKPF